LQVCDDHDIFSLAVIGFLIYAKEEKMSIGNVDRMFFFFPSCGADGNTPKMSSVKPRIDFLREVTVGSSGQAQGCCSPTGLLREYLCKIPTSQECLPTVCQHKFLCRRNTKIFRKNRLTILNQYSIILE
jgi:hypothetical protein